MRLAERLNKIQPSQTLAVSAKVKDLEAQGVDVVDLSAGEPDFKTPDHIRRSAFDAMEAGHTKYTKVAGIDELRDAVCGKLERDNGLSYSREQVLISCGGKHTLYNAFMAALTEGDEVIIPSPYWVSFPEQVKLAGGNPVLLELDPAECYRIPIQSLSSVLTERTRAVVLNSPSNPTGNLLGTDFIKEVVDAAVERDLLIISDETYEQIVFDGEYVSTATYDGAYEQTLTVNSMSKTYSMTGWRIGYAAGPELLIKAMTKIQSQSTSNPNSIAQAASVDALIGDQGIVSEMREKFRKRRDYLYQTLNDIPGIRCDKPEGSFYIFPDVSDYYGRSSDGKKIGNSVEISEFILEKARVAVVPGVAFGSDANIRISYATSMEQLEKGVARIREALLELG